MMTNLKLYLDDMRIPKDKEWILVTNYDEFVETVTKHGLKNFTTMSLDHDLGDTAMVEYFNNVAPNYQLNYENITEKTGLDCVKWLIEHWMETRKQIPHPTMDGLYINDPHEPFNFPTIYVHSANPIGSGNIIGYVNNFLKNTRQPQTCVRVRIEHTNINING